MRFGARVVAVRIGLWVCPSGPFPGRAGQLLIFLCGRYNRDPAVRTFRDNASRSFYVNQNPWRQCAVLYIRMQWRWCAQLRPTVPCRAIVRHFSDFLSHRDRHNYTLWVSCRNVYSSYYLFCHCAFYCVYRSINSDIGENENVVKSRF